MPKHIDEEIEFSRQYQRGRNMPLAKALRPEPWPLLSEGQLEDLETKVEKLTEVCGRLLAFLVVQGLIDLSECSEILGDNFEISELEQLDF